MENELVVFDPIETAIAALTAEYSGRVFDASTPAGMKETKAARTRIRKLRTSTDALRKDLKRPHIDANNQIEAMAKRLIGACREFEEPIAAVIKAEDDRKTAEKAEALRLEQERVAKIRKLIEHIAGVPLTVAGKSADEVYEVIEKVGAFDISDEMFGELADDAAAAWRTTLDRLGNLHERQLKAEEAIIKAEDAIQKRERAVAEREAEAESTPSTSEPAAPAAEPARHPVPAPAAAPPAEPVSINHVSRWPAGAVNLIEAVLDICNVETMTDTEKVDWIRGALSDLLGKA